LATPANGASVTFGLTWQGSGLYIGTVAPLYVNGAPAEIQQVGAFQNVSAFCQALLPPNASAAGFSRTCMQFLINAGYQFYPVVQNVPTYNINGYLPVAGLNN